MNYTKKLVNENKSPYLIALLALLFISFLASCYSVFSINNKQNKYRNEALSQVQQQTKNASIAINEKLEVIRKEVDQFAQEVSQLTSTEELNSILKKEFEENPQLFSLNITLKPYFLGDDIQYFSPYYERLGGLDNFFELDGYDSGASDFTWYSRPLSEGAIWTEPYYEKVNDVLMTTYSVPFSLPNITNSDELVGVIPSDVSLNYLTEALKKLDLGLGGYGMLFTQSGSLISHPIFSYVRGLNTLDSLVNLPEFDFLNVVPKCFDPELDYAFYNGEVLLDDEDFVACTKVPQTDWILITRMSADMFGLHQDELRKGYIKSVLLITVSVCLIILIMTQQRFLTAAQDNILISSALIVAAILVLYFAKTLGQTQNKDITVITNQSQRAAFIENIVKQVNETRAEQPIFVPTGLTINSIEFVTAQNIHATGVVWQHYSPDILDVLNPGVIFPKAIHQEFRPIYQHATDEGDVVWGWEFEATLREQFKYGKYPFDGKDIYLPIKHIDYTSNVVLTPDLEAYAKIASKDNPAVANNLVLEEWQLSHSYFNYREMDSNANFGLNTFNNDAFKPTLSYNLHLEREFISPFVTALLPVIVMMCLLYACIVSMPHTQYDELRNNITAVIFTILLAHYSIRQHLQIDEVVYLEMFYFLLYVVASVFMFLSHSYYVAKSNNEPYKGYERWAINTYWPVISSMILVTSIWTYY